MQLISETCTFSFSLNELCFVICTPKRNLFDVLDESWVCPFTMKLFPFFLSICFEGLGRNKETQKLLSGCCFVVCFIWLALNTCVCCETPWPVGSIFLLAVGSTSGFSMTVSHHDCIKRALFSDKQIVQSCCILYLIFLHFLWMCYHPPTCTLPFIISFYK